MRRLLLVAVLAAVAAVTMAARPGDDHNMFIRLNGQETRWRMSDGGASGMFGSGISCMPVAPDAGFPAAANGVIELVPTTPINLCYVNVNALPPWDGGCGLNAGDPNQGVSLQPGAKFVVLKDTTTHLCQASDAGTATTPVFSMQ